MTDPGTRFVTALAAKDTPGLLALFADDVTFRGMTPGRFWEADSPQAVVHDVLYQWFEAVDVVEAVEHLETARAVSRQRVDYRLLVRNPDGLFAVEQRAYYDTDGDGRITRMHALCAGYQPVPAPR